MPEPESHIMGSKSGPLFLVFISCKLLFYISEHKALQILWFVGQILQLHCINFQIIEILKFLNFTWKVKFSKGPKLVLITLYNLMKVVLKFCKKNTVGCRIRWTLESFYSFSIQLTHQNSSSSFCGHLEEAWQIRKSLLGNLQDIFQCHLNKIFESACALWSMWCKLNPRCQNDLWDRLLSMSFKS